MKNKDQSLGSSRIINPTSTSTGYDKTTALEPADDWSHYSRDTLRAKKSNQLKTNYSCEYYYKSITTGPSKIRFGRKQKEIM